MRIERAGGAVRDVRAGPIGVSAPGRPRRTRPAVVALLVPDRGKDRPDVLPRPRRVNRPVDFRRVLRRGRKCGRRRLVVHVHRDGDGPARAGLVVGKVVGTAVERHRVSRRLRHLLAERLEELPPGTDLVVRAQPAAAHAPSAELGADLDGALLRLGLAGRRG